MTSRSERLESRTSPLLLVTGATGYIGGRLVRALSERGAAVRCLARRPDEARARLAPGTSSLRDARPAHAVVPARSPSAPQHSDATGPRGIEVVGGDVLAPESLEAALAGVRTAWYLVHAMASPRGFAEEERAGARNFARAAAAASVRRIIYLGGLGGDAALSPHLASRHEVGRLLRESGVPVLELRASVIIGSGSLSFELVRALVERLPVLITPRWVRQRTQPIAIDDVLAYLVAAADVPMHASTVVEVGGRDRVSYLDLMREYAAQRRLRRVFIPVPVLTPWLSSRWLGLVTPVYARVGRKLIDSLRNETVVTSARAREMFPGIEPRGVRDAIAQALVNEDRDIAETRWSDARSSLGSTRRWGGEQLGSRLIDTRTVAVQRPPSIAFRPIAEIGGARGWYYGNWMWRLRGFADLLVGGAGLRRGRRDPDALRAGDALDFWRVESFEPARLLRLRAEMKVPGRAWLQFEVSGDDAESTIRQTAIFEPRGLAGLLYWYALFPVHGLIFGGMLRGIARAARMQLLEPRPLATGGTILRFGAERERP